MIATVQASGAVRHRSSSWPALYLLGYFLVVGLALALLGGGPAQLAFFAVIGLSTGAGFLVQAGTRVLDPECTVCQRCIAACPHGSLALTIGLDASVGRDRIPTSG